MRVLADITPQPLCSQIDSAALPLSVRVTERLVEILFVATALRSDLKSHQAAHVRWLIPHIDCVRSAADTLIRKLAS